MTEYTDPDGRPLYGNAQCGDDHPLWLVAEGYAYCRGAWLGVVFYAPWRLTEPSCNSEKWVCFPLSDGLFAWVSFRRESLQDVLDDIQEDMDAHRQLAAANHVEAPPYAEWLASVR